MKQRFQALLKPLFPKGAEFRHVQRHTDELMFRVDWKSPTEGRPNKRSRPIEICISQETQEDWQGAARNEDREAMDERIVQYVEQRLAAFNPNHEVPRHVPVPAERWVITSEISG
jgi:hypothetical protein